MFGHVSIPYQSHEKILCFQQYHLSEIWANTKLNILICLLPIWHLFLCGFNWWRINWRYGKNFDLLQLIIPEIMRILLAFSYFPTYSEIWSPPVLPLLERRSTVLLLLLLLLLHLCMSRSGDPPWILKWAGLESSDRRLISSIGKTKRIAFFFGKILFSLKFSD